MKNFSRIILLILIAISSVFPAWNARAEESGEPVFKILAATFPVYLFALNICAKVPHVQLELLIPAETGCPHDFALKPADMRKLVNADVLIINGNDLEDFLAKPLADESLRLKVLDAGANVPTLPATAGEHDYAHVNPHTFAAPRQAALMATNISAGLAALNPENAAAYAKNGAAYAEALTALSMRFETVGGMAKNKNVAIGHDSLAYLMQNAGLDVVAILENSVSIAGLSSLKKKLLENRPVVLAGDSQYGDRVLKTLSMETGIPYALLDSCATGPVNPPLNYYQQVMAGNLRILEKYFE